MSTEMVLSRSQSSAQPFIWLWHARTVTLSQRASLPPCSQGSWHRRRTYQTLLRWSSICHYICPSSSGPLTSAWNSNCAFPTECRSSYLIWGCWTGAESEGTSNRLMECEKLKWSPCLLPVEGTNELNTMFLHLFLLCHHQLRKTSTPLNCPAY